MGGPFRPVRASLPEPTRHPVDLVCRASRRCRDASGRSTGATRPLRDRVVDLLRVVMRPSEPVANERAGRRRTHAAAWRSGRPGSLLTLAPHRSGRAGSAASGSSTDSFATRRRVPAGPGSQSFDRPGGYPFRDVASLRVRLGQLTRLDLHQLDCSLVGCSLPHPAPRQTASLRAVAYPLVQEARRWACLASSAIRCRDVETGPNLGVLAVFPSNGATCRCPLPSTGSRGLNSPASAVL